MMHISNILAHEPDLMQLISHKQFYAASCCTKFKISTAHDRFSVDDAYQLYQKYRNTFKFSDKGSE
jgi:predicted RNase H-like nuclease (RuvC/YqgF family)